MFLSGNQRRRFATSEVSRIFGLEPELDRRDYARHLPRHGQPQGVGLQRQRYQKGIISDFHSKITQQKRRSKLVARSHQEFTLSLV